MKDVGNGFELSTGRRLRANGGVLGMSEALRLTSGYDDTLYLEPDDGHCWQAEELGVLTDDERREIADHMIGLWQKWALGWTMP
jgi:hypothetical protein